MKQQPPQEYLSGYNAVEHEVVLYPEWEAAQIFNPEQNIKDGVTEENAPVFSMVLPPPNVTGILHTGHAIMCTVEDVFTRFHRMNGYRTLWIPGADHAAIATQSKVEKELEKKGIKPRQLPREELFAKIQEYAMESKSTIQSQLRAMGSSLDWSREAFTLDEARQEAVVEAFKRLYNLGLIYQGERIVNWDPKGQTVISDDEIIYKEETSKFYELQYGPFVIGTVRPETKFGDKYVVVHPDDARYAQFNHGDTFECEWINGPITATVIKDDSIDMEFGTGAMTITPWHSKVDFEIANRHNLEKEQIIDTYGKLLPVAGDFAGMKISEARAKIIEKLKEKNLVVSEKDYTHNVATAERTEGMVEPQIMKQWFVAVEKEFVLEHSEIDGINSGDKVTLKGMMQHVVNNKSIAMVPERYEAVYFSWINNLHDWCISRQIIYGHRIPVWTHPVKGTEISLVSPDASDTEWSQDPDTLDTWFSSALWTFSTLGWPNTTDDLKIYHPTSMLETGPDILFFWVARMILMSTTLIGQIPFKTVYFHGTVYDEKGRKISKSLGNGIDPLEIRKTHGIDALRMALTVGNPPGSNLNLGTDKVGAYKKYTNKLWNIARFCLSYYQKPDMEVISTSPWGSYVAEQQEMMNTIGKNIENHKIYLAAEEAYHYTWHTFADKIIEELKTVLADTEHADYETASHTLSYLFKNLLTMNHVFMPFITEKIWKDVRTLNDDLPRFLAITQWNK
ncbi:MAG TPA: valine--tRNA ligase [Candidatus Paceibacterota bacterium]